jgi:hypothetical protein
LDNLGPVSNRIVPIYRFHRKQVMNILYLIGI